MHESGNPVIHPKTDESVKQTNASESPTLLETTTLPINTTEYLDISLETQESLQNDFVDKSTVADTKFPRFHIADLRGTTQKPSLRKSETNPSSQRHTVPYTTTTQSPRVLESTSSSYEVTTTMDTRYEPTEVTTPFIRAPNIRYKERVPFSTTEQYTTQRHGQAFPSVFVDNYESDEVTHPPQTSTEKDFDFFNLTESGYDAVTEQTTATTTRSAPITSRIFPLKMLSSPTEMSMDFSSFNDDGIFDEDAVDPAVALSERVSVSLETTTTEMAPSLDDNEVEHDTESPSMNGAHPYPTFISLVSSLVMFLPILYNVLERRI